MKTFFVLLVVLLTGCAGSGASRWFDASELKPVQEEDASMVILDGRMELTSEVKGKFSTEQVDAHFALQILTQAGVESAYLRIPHKEKAEIEDLRARSIDPDGTVRELVAKDIHEDVEEISTHGDADNPRKAKENVTVFRIPGVKVGSIVEWGFRMVGTGHYAGEFDDGLPSWLPVPVKRFVLEIVVNDRIRYAVRPYNSDVPVKKTKEGGRTRLSWTLLDLPARETDEFAPDTSMERPWLAFRVKQLVHGKGSTHVYLDWPDAMRHVGDRLSVEKDLFDAEPPDLGCGDDVRCKIENALAEVRKSELTTTGWWLSEARPVSKIRGSGKVTPLDKEVLMLHALRGAGIDARPVALMRPFTRLYDPEFPSPTHFNSLSIYLPVQKGLIHAMWIDPACENCKAGQLSDALHGAQAMVIDAQGRFEKDSDVKVERIVPEGEDPPPDTSERVVDMRVDASGLLQATRTMNTSGEPATDIRLDRRDFTESDWKALGKETAAEVSTTATVVGKPIGSCDAAAGTCTSTIQLEAPAYATVFADKMLVPLSATTGRLDGMFKSKKRTSAMAFRKPEVTRAIARVHVPQGYRPASMPERIEKKVPGLEAMMEAHQEGDVVVVSRTLTFHPGIYPKEEYDRYSEVARSYAAGKDLTLTFVKAP